MIIQGKKKRSKANENSYSYIELQSLSFLLRKNNSWPAGEKNLFANGCFWCLCICSSYKKQKSTFIGLFSINPKGLSMPPLEPLILSAPGSQGTRGDLAKLVFLRGVGSSLGSGLPYSHQALPVLTLSQYSGKVCKTKSPGRALGRLLTVFHRLNFMNSSMYDSVLFWF